MDWQLKPLQGFTPRPGPLLVVVLDGVGIGAGDEGDAVSLARTPVLDWLRDNCPWVTLKAHGTAVGLPSDADMGNSEVGHNALGAGRVFDQGAKLVSHAIASGSLTRGATWRKMIDQVTRQNSALHLIGLLSDGNVHSHQNHLEALIVSAAQAGVKKLFVHPLLDGRDVSETSALLYIDRLEKFLAGYHGVGGATYQIASGGGRMTTTMDRYQADWRIVERGWAAHVHGDARQFSSATEAINTIRSEEEGITDQFLPAFVIASGDKPVAPIVDNDAVIFFNFRGDRAIEISNAFELEQFDHFDRGRVPKVFYAGMMEYDGDAHIPQNYLVTPPEISHTLGEYLVHNGVRQFACSETQKFGHVTYFWNGNRAGYISEALEEYLEIPSDLIPFEQRPWMKAAEITDETILRIKKGTFRFGRINYPNGDMVGHTGDRRAAIVGLEALDLVLARLLNALNQASGMALVTADHGNSDQMYERTKSGDLIIDPVSGHPKPLTSHTLNPVRCSLFDPAGLAAKSNTLSPLPPGLSRPSQEAGTPETSLSLSVPTGGAGLANVSATCLNLLGFEAPEQMEPSLLTIKTEDTN